MKRLILLSAFAVNAFSAIQYAGGTNVNAQCTATLGTKQELASCIQDNLTTAGWTVNSGSHSATIVMQSATTPTAGLNMILTITTAATNCVTLKSQNVAGTKIQITGNFLLPAISKVFRVIANKYQGFISTDGAAASRTVAAFGVLYVPSFAGVTEAIWATGDAQSDTDTNIEPNWKCSLNIDVAQGTCSNTATNVWVTINGTQWENTAGVNNGSYGLPHFMVLQPTYGGFTASVGATWFDGSAFISEPIMSIGSTVGAAGKTIGQLWDAAIITASSPAETSLTFDSHNWLTWTNSVTFGTASTPVATLALVVP